MIKIIKEFFRNLSGKKQVILTPEDIKKSKHFCMIPWIHTHVLPNSKVIPCCVSDYLDVFGDTKKNTLTEIWNGTRYRTMRRLMIADRPVFSCNKCYELEASGINTMRTRTNDKFSHYSEELKKTKNNGYLQNPKMRYFDIRFSNICNFKCRGCSPALSTKWYEDYQKLWNFTSKEPKLINATKDSPTLWQEIQDYLPQVEVAYFAGGEPLLMDEHYQTLEKLIEIGNTNITLQYNTNLSVLKFKKYDLIHLWKHFKEVELTVSLDDIESRGEYFRSGLDWEKLVSNFKEIRDNFPNIYFQVNCTISLFNIHRIPEIHSALMEFDFIDDAGFNFNTLLDPPEYRTQVLPESYKAETSLKLKSYIKKLNILYPMMNWDYFKSSLVNQIHFMNSADLSENIPNFKEMTLKLDEIRTENFTETYPELAGLVE
jgi:MoaA/NifB/PqqE/SkfB family radical SAM enzyme